MRREEKRGIGYTAKEEIQETSMRWESFIFLPSFFHSQCS
jgi:hypothetical protein